MDFNAIPFVRTSKHFDIASSQILGEGFLDW